MNKLKISLLTLLSLGALITLDAPSTNAKFLKSQTLVSESANLTQLYKGEVTNGLTLNNNSDTDDTYLSFNFSKNVENVEDDTYKIDFKNNSCSVSQMSQGTYNSTDGYQFSSSSPVTVTIKCKRKYILNNGKLDLNFDIKEKLDNKEFIYQTYKQQIEDYIKPPSFDLQDGAQLYSDLVKKLGESLSMSGVTIDVKNILSSYGITEGNDSVKQLLDGTIKIPDVTVTKNSDNSSYKFQIATHNNTLGHIMTGNITESSLADNGTVNEEGLYILSHLSDEEKKTELTNYLKVMFPNETEAQEILNYLNAVSDKGDILVKDSNVISNDSGIKKVEENGFIKIIIKSDVQKYYNYILSNKKFKVSQPFSWELLNLIGELSKILGINEAVKDKLIDFIIINQSKTKFNDYLIYDNTGGNHTIAKIYTKDNDVYYYFEFEDITIPEGVGIEFQNITSTDKKEQLQVTFTGANANNLFDTTKSELSKYFCNLGLDKINDQNILIIDKSSIDNACSNTTPSDSEAGNGTLVNSDSPNSQPITNAGDTSNTQNEDTGVKVQDNPEDNNQPNAETTEPTTGDEAIESLDSGEKVQEKPNKDEDEAVNESNDNSTEELSADTTKDDPNKGQEVADETENKEETEVPSEEVKVGDNPPDNPDNTEESENTNTPEDTNIPENISTPEETNTPEDTNKTDETLTEEVSNSDTKEQ